MSEEKEWECAVNVNITVQASSEEEAAEKARRELDGFGTRFISVEHVDGPFDM